MNLMNARTMIGIGAVALTLAGGVAPGLVDAKDRKGDVGGGGRARAERGVEAGFYIPPQVAKCNGVLATMFLSQFPAGEPVHGTDGRDVVIGTSGPDDFYGNRGDDLVCLKGGNDIFRPGTDAGSPLDGDDTVFGGPGADTMNGGSGTDDLRGEEDGDFLRGGDGGGDVCNGGPGGDTQLQPIGCEIVQSIP